MGLSTYFFGTVRRTNIEEVLKVLSVVSGNLYMLIPNKNGIWKCAILKDGLYTGISYIEENEPDYKDGYINGKKVRISHFVDYPLKGDFEHYFEPFIRTMELMGESEYNISSEFGSEYSSNGEFKRSGNIRLYLNSYNSYLNTCTCKMFAEHLERAKGVLHVKEMDFLNKKIQPLIEEQQKGKKEYDYFGIKFNMLLFIYWAYHTFGYSSLNELKEKFGKEETLQYRKYIEDCKDKYSDGIEFAFALLGGGTSPNYNYERGLGFLLKNIE